jgi:hypothetical protein
MKLRPLRHPVGFSPPRHEGRRSRERLMESPSGPLPSRVRSVKALSKLLLRANGRKAPVELGVSPSIGSVTPIPAVVWLSVYRQHYSVLVFGSLAYQQAHELLPDQEFESLLTRSKASDSIKPWTVSPWRS